MGSFGFCKDSNLADHEIVLAIGGCTCRGSNPADLSSLGLFTTKWLEELNHWVLPSPVILVRSGFWRRGCNQCLPYKTSLALPSELTPLVEEATIGGNQPPDQQKTSSEWSEAIHASVKRNTSVRRNAYREEK